ncbi:hypothetical protein HNR44_000892 [Geomicrobium halophilum]|uniref:Uncharacterized protein n=1 Tax=Geomicrobium halophilum TaxID=549000 RepID=A0A841PX23_9BACL|nr:hypothetical protein [Geomicrobium halophilum]
MRLKKLTRKKFHGMNRIAAVSGSPLIEDVQKVRENFLEKEHHFFFARGGFEEEDSKAVEYLSHLAW